MPINKMELLKCSFENNQALISNADSKANIVFGVQTFIIATVLGAAVWGDTYKSIGDYSQILRVTCYGLYSAFILSSATGITMCMLAFKPRPPQEKREIERTGTLYFGHIVKLGSSDSYLEEVKKLNEDGLEKEFAYQNYSLAVILRNKLKFIRIASVFIYINILIGMVLVIMSLIAK